MKIFKFIIFTELIFKNPGILEQIWFRADISKEYADMIKEIYKLAGPPKPAWHAVHQTIKFPALAGYSIIKVSVKLLSVGK